MCRRYHFINFFIQRQRLYQFLVGINDNLDKEKCDLLHQDPLPTLDAVYATKRREITCRGIMGGDSSSGRGPSEICSGMVVHHRSENSSSWREDRSFLKCSHCGGSRHTKDGCFKLIGYPEWWEELKQRKAATKAKVSWTSGKTNLITVLSSDQQPQQKQVTADKGPRLGNNTINNSETSFISITSTSKNGAKIKQATTKNGKGKNTVAICGERESEERENRRSNFSKMKQPSTENGERKI